MMIGFVGMIIVITPQKILRRTVEEKFQFLNKEPLPSMPSYPRYREAQTNLAETDYSRHNLVPTVFPCQFSHRSLF